MKDRRGFRGNEKWRKEVKKRDEYACRRCDVGVGYDLHAHHIKPRAKYPEFALVLENGLTLCAECHKTWHRLLKGKEESPNLRVFMQVFMPGDAKIDRQLRLIEGNITNFIEKKLSARNRRARDEGAHTLFSHLNVYPNSLSEMVRLLVFVVNGDTWPDESETKCRAIEWLHKTTEDKLEFNCRTCQEKLRVRVTNGRRPLQQRFDCKRCLSSYEYGTIQSGSVRISTQPSVAKQAISEYQHRVERRRNKELARQRLEAQKREAERREAQRGREQEIISKYGSLEAHKQHPACRD